jgi:2-(1,2-epoxy-1,2-dihydrophenyl)acetyl-CoA isomerase
VSLGYATEDGVAVLTLSRPHVLNAFDDDLGRRLLEAVRIASEDVDVRCIVITGAGRAFCSGEDLGALSAAYEAGGGPDLGGILVERYNPLVSALCAAPKPVLAALNGVAAGAGASLALACDYRVASDAARIVLGFARVGLVPDSGALWFLARIVGSARAWELATLDRAIEASEALRLGVVNEVVAASDFEAAWRARAAALARGPTRAFALTKRLLHGAPERSLEEQLELEVDAQREASRSRDHRAGVRAFLEKSRPRFEGR